MDKPNLPPPTTTTRPIKLAEPPPPMPQFAPKPSFSGSLKNWLGGLVNNPTTGALSHDKVWANVAAGLLSYKFYIAAPADEWQWWAYGGMVGGYGLARRAIAAVQQSVEKKEE